MCGFGARRFERDADSIAAQNTCDCLTIVFLQILIIQLFVHLILYSSQSLILSQRELLFFSKDVHF